MNASTPPLAQSHLKAKIITALHRVYQACHGAFACVAMIDAAMIVGFRDPFGIKPLVLGRRSNADGSIDYMLASESVALEKLDFDFVQDVAPG